MQNWEDEFSTRAYVRNLVIDELRRRDEEVNEGEPLVMLSVKLPVTDLARLEQIAGYLGHKKTPFAGMLLKEAIEDAYWALIVTEDDNGRGEEARSYFNQRHHLEDGSGWVGGPMSNGEGEVG